MVTSFVVLFPLQLFGWLKWYFLIYPSMNFKRLNVLGYNPEPKRMKRFFGDFQLQTLLKIFFLQGMVNLSFSLKKDKIQRGLTVTVTTKISAVTELRRDVNKRRRIFLRYLFKLECGCQNFNSRKIRPHLTFQASRNIRRKV